MNVENIYSYKKCLFVSDPGCFDSLSHLLILKSEENSHPLFIVLEIPLPFALILPSTPTIPTNNPSPLHHPPKLPKPSQFSLPNNMLIKETSNIITDLIEKEINNT